MLTPQERFVYDRIYSRWARFRNGVVIRRAEHSPEYDYSRIVSAINMDHPEIFWIDCFSQFHITTRTLNPYIPALGIQDELRVKMLFSSESEIRRLQQELNAWRQRALDAIPADRDDRNKLWILLDFIARGVKYRECGLAQSHTILGCFNRYQHEAVCQGIAAGMKFLCEAFNIPCIIVAGDYVSPYDSSQGPHAWNIFSIGNQFRHLDATAELQYAQQYGSAREQSVAMADDEARRAGYHWDSSLVPTCRRI